MQFFCQIFKTNLAQGIWFRNDYNAVEFCKIQSGKPSDHVLCKPGFTIPFFVPQIDEYSLTTGKLVSKLINLKNNNK